MPEQEALVGQDPFTVDKQIRDRSELLLRQVHPNWVQDGRPTSQAFRPTNTDHGLLSVSRASMVSPEEAFKRHTQRGLQSYGVWAVTVGECNQDDCCAFPDPVPDDDAHAVIDFRHHGNNKCRAVSQRLVSFACERGPRYVAKTGEMPATPAPVQATG